MTRGQLRLLRTALMMFVFGMAGLFSVLIWTEPVPESVWGFVASILGQIMVIGAAMGIGLGIFKATEIDE